MWREKEERRGTKRGDRRKVSFYSRAREQRMSLYEENGFEGSGKEEEKEVVGKRNIEKEAVAR